MRHPREDVNWAVEFWGQELRGGVWTVNHLIQVINEAVGVDEMVQSGKRRRLRVET